MSKIDSALDHQLVKIATPLALAALIGAVTWMFTSVIDLQNRMTLFTKGKVINIEQKLNAVSEDVDDMWDKITELRINIRPPRERNH
jgi:Na+/phosphate symporter